jgi:acyl-CoA thioesterase YciA
MAAPPPEQEPAIRTIAMPADTYPAGDNFGGWRLAQMDLAAGNVAARRARGRCATAAIDKITFVVLDSDGRPRPVPLLAGGG